VDAIVFFRGLQTALMAFAFGIGLQVCGRPDAANQGIHAQARHWMLKLLVLSVALATVRIVMAVQVLHDMSGAPLDIFLVFQTYNSQVLAGQCLCLTIALLLVCSSATRMAAWFLLLAMMATAMSGHVVAASQTWWQIAVSCVHVWPSFGCPASWVCFGCLFNRVTAGQHGWPSFPNWHCPPWC
jgi:hypothetical protein